MNHKHGKALFIFVTLPPKQFQHLDSMLQGPLPTCIILKDPNIELGIIVIIYLPSMQKSLRLPNGNNLRCAHHVLWPIDFPPFLPLRVDSDYRSIMGAQMHDAIQEDTLRTTKKDSLPPPLIRQSSPSPSLGGVDRDLSEFAERVRQGRKYHESGRGGRLETQEEILITIVEHKDVRQIGRAHV